MPTDAVLPPFDGWDTPHYTPIPDQLFDEWLPHLSEAELKVLLYIMRHTFGFKKDSDAISLTQMAEGIIRTEGTRQDYGAGVTRRSVLRALPALLHKGLIAADKHTTSTGDAATTVYRLCLRGQGQIDPTPRLYDPTGRDKLTLRVGPESPPQETVLQETESQDDSNHSAPRKKPRPRQDVTDTPVSASLLAPCPENPPCDPATPAASYSAYIAGGIFDHSAELGDAAHKAANSTQAHRLWQASGRDEAAFVALLHEARTRVRKGQGQQGSGSITNKMGYYFRCLAALLDAAP